MSERLDKIILQRYPDFSRSRIEGLIKSGFVTVNGACAEKAGMKVNEDDDICVEIPPPVPAEPEPEDLPLDIIFEDDDILVINKAPGVVVHPAPGHFTGTIVNAILHHCPNLSGIGGVARPGIVHRLDQDTSGILVIAKTQVAMDNLARAFASHKNMEKTYIAICHGRPRLNCGRIENFIGRHPVDRKRMAIVEKGGKLAITNWKVLSDRENLPYTIMECKIETGRTHQIRVHMASLGCPVVGDKVYGKPSLDKRLGTDPNADKVYGKPSLDKRLGTDPNDKYEGTVPNKYIGTVPKRQLLHAYRLGFWHPVRNVPMEFVAPIPGDMQPYFTKNVQL